jgi:hypothetical protein
MHGSGEVSVESGKSAASLALVFLLMVVTGCASSAFGWQVRTDSTPILPPFHPADLEQQPVALLTALGLPAFRGNEVALDFHLDEILHAIEPRWNLVSSQETATRINGHGLAADYVKMRNDYELTNLLDRDTLRKIGRAVGVRYVFQPRLAAFDQMMTDRWIFPIFNVRMTQTRSSIMRLSLQLWDAETGALVWASFAETNMANEAATQDPVYFEDIAHATLASMIEDFRKGKTDSKYTPLHHFLDRLIEESMPTETP